MRKYEKITYEVDPHNRLILKSGKPSGIKRYRAVLDGTFKIDKNNYLIYHAKKPSPVFRGKRLPQKIKLKGSWSLSKKHNLIYTLDKWQNQIYGNRLILKSGVMNTRTNRLLFTLTTKEEPKRKTYILGLSGAWQVDSTNRLSFNIEKKRGRDDSIILMGAWKIGSNNEIVYTYNRKNKTRKLVFKGYWDTIKKHRIFYRLYGKNGTLFGFKVSAGTSTRSGFLQYRMGIGLSRRKRPKMKVITLYGKWRIKQNLGLIFEMNYGKDKVHSITFGASIKLNKNYTLDVSLKDKRNSSLGIKLTLKKSFLKNQATSFISLIKANRELAIVVGTGILF